MKIDFTNKIVLVTGANGGIGRSISRFFAEANATVLLHGSRDNPGLNRFCDSLPGGSERNQVFVADFRQLESIKSMFEKIQKGYGRLDFLINNAGARIANAFEAVSMDQLEETFRINFFAAYQCAQNAVPLMMSDSGGRMIFITSVDAHLPGSNRTDYAAAKGAEVNLVKNLALELAEKRILVNAVSPGAIKTPMTKSIMGETELYQSVLRGIPLSRFGDPEEVAAMTLFLCSDYSRYTTGSVVTIDGGISLKRGY